VQNELLSPITRAWLATAIKYCAALNSLQRWAVAIGFSILLAILMFPPYDMCGGPLCVITYDPHDSRFASDPGPMTVDVFLLGLDCVYVILLTAIAIRTLREPIVTLRAWLCIGFAFIGGAMVLHANDQLLHGGLVMLGVASGALYLALTFRSDRRAE